MTDTEWTPSTVASVTPGQTVRLEHEDGSVLIRTVRLPRKEKWLVVDLVESDITTSMFLRAMVNQYAWRLFVHPTPKPILPTEPNTIWADRNGYPWFVTGMGNLVTHQIDIHGPAELAAPFVRLESQPVTATAILKRVAEVRYTKNFDDVITALAAEYGADLS